MLTPDDPNITRSFSQLSVSQETPLTTTTSRKKKKKKKEETNGSSMENETLATTYEKSYPHGTNLSFDINHTDRLKSEYLRVSNTRLKDMLMESSPNRDQIASYLNNDEKIQVVRQIIELSNQLQYLQLQEHLWQAYYNLGISAGQWEIRVSKSYAKHHGVCRSYGYPRHIVEKRQQNIQYQTQKINEQLQHLLQQCLPIFDYTALGPTIDACIQKGQQRLRDEFDYRKQILILNANDHDSLKKFYQLQPDHEHVSFILVLVQQFHYFISLCRYY